MKNWTFFLLFFFALWACDSRRVLIPPKLVWKSNPFKNLQIETIYPVFFDDKIIVSQNSPNGSSELLALSVLDGSVAWRYSDKIDSLSAFYYNLKPYIFDSILVLPNGTHTFAINMKTGKKLWLKKIGSFSEQFLEGYGRYVFQSCYESNQAVFVCRFDCLSGHCDTIYREGSPAGCRKVIRTPALIVENGILKHLLLCKTEQKISSRLTVSTITFVNAENWQIEKIDTISKRNVDGISFTKQPQIDSTSKKIYFVLNEHLICYNLANLSFLWKSILPRDMLTSEINYCSNSIFFPSEDGFLYSIGKNSGDIVWKCKISGTPSRGYLVGKYFNIIGGGNGCWYIIDTDNGKIVAEISTPNLIKYEEIFWRRYFTVSSIHKLAIATDGKEYALYSFK